MNKKISFIFLVLLCSINLMMFAQNDRCRPLYTVGNGLVLRADQDFSVDKSIYKYAFKIIVRSTSSSTIVINNVDTKQSYGYQFLTSPLGDVLAPRGSTSFIYLTNEALPLRYITITAQICD